MKNVLLVCALAQLSSFLSAQELGEMTTDENGKIHFQQSLSFDNLTPNASENNLNPIVLNIDWSSPDYDISNNPSLDSWDPRMAVGQEGNVYVVYNDNHSNGLQKIMFRKKVENEDWSSPIFVDTGTDIGGRNNHFPAIATSPNGDLHVIYNVWAFENVRNFIGYSHFDAATETWDEGVKISDLNGTVNHFTSHHDLYSTQGNLPVVLWGYDYRADLEHEEIYMKYFDGTSWSADISVSTENDGFNSGYPFIRSLGNGTAMILFAEQISGTEMELKYRIYNETTHTLSSENAITSQFIKAQNYVVSGSPNGEIKVFLIHKETDPSRDVINVFDYDSATDSFSLSTNVYEVAANAGSLTKWMDADCKSDGDCGVFLTDFSAENLSFMEYNSSTGFGTPEVIIEQNPGFDEPNIRFDSGGNVHAVWSDYRFNDGQGWDEREVFYKLGINDDLATSEVSTPTVQIYPNPSNGTFTVSYEKDKDYVLKIYDLSGRLLQTNSVKNKSKVSTPFSSGTYILKFLSGNDVHVKKLIIKK